MHDAAFSEPLAVQHPSLNCQIFRSIHGVYRSASLLTGEGSGGGGRGKPPPPYLVIGIWSNYGGETLPWGT